MRIEFGYIPVASSLVDDQGLQNIISPFLPALESIGGRQCHPKNMLNDSPLFFLVVTGGTERQLLNLRAERNKFFPGEPVALIAHPGNNSLPAALEVLARLQQDGTAGQIIYLKHPDDQTGFQEIEIATANLNTRRILRQARIGLLGEPSDWLVASTPDPAIVQKTWGPEVVTLDLNELIERVETVSSAEIQALLDSLVAGAKEVREPSQKELEKVVRIYFALKKMVKRRHLNAVTVRCFDLVTQLKTSGCFALAQLNDEGIIAGCEGDLVSAVGMLWARTLLDQIPWMANPVQIDTERNSFWMAHCTVPRNLVKEYRLRSHFESGEGMGIQGDIAAGPVTIFRIGGKNLEKIWVAEGEILKSGHAENLCRTQVEILLTNGDQVPDLLRAPLGNHLILVQGHHAQRLYRCWENIISEK